MFYTPKSFNYKSFLTVLLLSPLLALKATNGPIKRESTAPITGINESQRREALEIAQLHPTIHVDELYFPANFLFGFATAHYQIDGADNCQDCQWAHFEKSTPLGGKPHIDGNQQSGTACDHMHLYKEDIALMKNDFNVSTYRFSVAWDRIEPREGEWDERALQHHVDEVDELIRNGIEPMITLHHFVHPQWFEEKGGFLNEGNIEYFVRFAKKVFAALGGKVKLWGTFNEPNVFAFQGYLPLNKVFPPRNEVSWFASWQQGARVLKHLMQAHTEVYRALKKMPHGNTAQIGLVHQYLHMEAGDYNPISYAAGYLLNDFMAAPLNFLKTGTFSFSSWLGFCGEEYTAEEYSRNEKICDFVGINYYSHPVIRGMSPSCYQGEVMTDMPFAIYPHGIYRAIKDASEVGVPMYITENGIADRYTIGDWRREKMIREYLKMVSLAVEDGYDVRGYYFWTFTDNWEWNMGYDMNFGLYSVDFSSPAKTRTLKQGGRVYANIIKAARAGKLQKHTSDFIDHAAGNKQSEATA